MSGGVARTTIALNTGSFFLQAEDTNGGGGSVLRRHMYEIYNDYKEVFKMYYVYQENVRELLITAHDVFEEFDLYNLTKNESMKEYCFFVGWEDEIRHYFDATSNVRSSQESLSQSNKNELDLIDVKSEFNRISCLTMGMSSATTVNDSIKHSIKTSTSRSNSPTNDVPSTGRSVRVSDSSPPALRREESFSMTLNKLLDDKKPSLLRMNSTDSDKVVDEQAGRQYGHLVFTEPCFLFLSKKMKAFSNHILQIYNDGHVVFTETKTQVASSRKSDAHRYKCGKLICFRVSSTDIDKEALKASKFLSDIALEEVAEVVIGVKLHETNNQLDSVGRVTNAYIIFSSLQKSKEFLQAVTKCVSVHNVMGYMIDMMWANGDDTLNDSHHTVHQSGKAEKNTTPLKGTGVDNVDDLDISDHDDDPLTTKERVSLLFLRNKDVTSSESRISIRRLDQNCLIHSQNLSTETLMAGVAYNPSTSEDASHEVTLLMDGVDLSKVKYFMMVTSLADCSLDIDYSSSMFSHGSRLLSPLARKNRTADDQSLERAINEVKDKLANNLKEVTCMSLKYCKVNEKGLFKLFASLRDNKALSDLNLCGNVFTTDNTSASLGNLLNFNKTLRVLDVQETMMGNVGSTLIAQSLHINNSITSLNLSANKIDAQGCVMLSSALSENTSLTYINLSRNVIGSRGAQLLAMSLHTNKHLLHLDLGRQRLKGKLGQDGAKYLAHCLMMNKSLRILRIGRNRLGFEGCRYISGALLTNRSLQVLDMSCNKIGIEGSIQVANAVLQNNCLEYVIIGYRRLPVCHLIGHYHENRRLTECSFVFNFGDYGVKDREEIAHSLVETEVEKMFEKELDFAYNLYFANDSSKIHSDSVFNAIRSDFRCIDFQVSLCQLLADSAISSKKTSVGKTNPGLPPEDLVFSISDEEAVFIAHLIKDNTRLEALRIDHAFLPIQKLRGLPFELEIENSGIIKESDKYNLDLSFSQLKCADAVVIGILIADNPRLQLISLHGNDFCKSEGETWISNGLAKNPSLGIDTSVWSAEEMYADGYHQLASLKGMSASGASIMPQRLEDWFDKLCLIGGSMAYYLDFLSDIYVTYLYSQNPEIYQTSWVVISAVFLCLPTCMLVYSIVWTTWTRKNWVGALQRLMIVVLQLHPVLHVFESLKVGIETTGYLDTRFLEGVYENIPQIALQTYIMFLVSVRNGEFDLPVFISVIISLASVSAVLVMLVDRGPVRSMCLGHAEHHPQIVKILASGLTVILVGNYHNTGNMKQLVNYSCHTYAHYVWAAILQFSSITVRIVALCWLLSTSEAYKIVVFGMLVTIRLVFILLFDPKMKSRPVMKNIIWAIVYTALTVVWDKDESSSVASHRGLVILNVLSSLENFVFIGYAAFLSTHTEMSIMQKVMACLIAVACIMISWYLFLTWKLPVHFPELYSQNFNYLRKKKEYKRKRASGLGGLRASDFEDVGVVLPQSSFNNSSLYSDKSLSVHDSVRTISLRSREKNFQLQRQNSKDLQNCYDDNSAKHKRKSTKKTWWSSLNKEGVRNSVRRKTTSQEASFNSAYGSPVDDSKIIESEEESSRLEKGERNHGKLSLARESSHEAAAGRFRKHSITSIQTHRSAHVNSPIPSSSFSRQGLSCSSEPSHRSRMSDISHDYIYRMNGSVDAPPCRKTDSNPSSDYSRVASGRFEYDNFLSERPTTYAPDGKVEEKGNVEFEMKTPTNAEVTASSSKSYEMKKQRLNKFRIGNILGRKRGSQNGNSPPSHSNVTSFDEESRKDML